jgi:hypothetical protein
VTDDEAVIRGREAQAVIGNRAYQEAWATFRNVLVAELERIEVSKERKAYLTDLLVALAVVRKGVEKTMADGKFAAESIKQDEIRKKWWSRAA